MVQLILQSETTSSYLFNFGPGFLGDADPEDDKDANANLQLSLLGYIILCFKMSLKNINVPLPPPVRPTSLI